MKGLLARHTPISQPSDEDGTANTPINSPVRFRVWIGCLMRSSPVFKNILKQYVGSPGSVTGAESDPCTDLE